MKIERIRGSPLIYKKVNQFNTATNKKYKAKEVFTHGKEKQG
jgi:hypothetical protein